MPNPKQEKRNMKRARTVAITGLFSVAVTLAGIIGASGQGAPASPSMKTIGISSAAAKAEIVPSLIVMNSDGASLDGTTLT